MVLTKETSLFQQNAIQSDVNTAAATANNYISDVDGSNQTGMTLQPANNSAAKNYIKLYSDGLDIYKNNKRIASYGNIITLYRLLNNNPIKTLEITDSGLYLYGSNTTQADVALVSTGLILSKGGIEAGNSGTNNFVYLSTKDYPLKNSNVSPAINGLTINGYTPSAMNTDGRTVDDAPWRQVIGTKFGVDAEGKLYASEATITGEINATSGSIANSVQIGGRSQIEYLNSEIYKNAGYQYTKDIIIYGDSDKYYPIYFNNNQDEYSQSIPHELMIARGFNEQAPDDWNTSTHKGSLTLQVKWNYGGWGGITYKAEILAFNEMYSTMVGDVVVGTGSGMLSTIYLRGGGTTGALYHIFSNIKIDSTRYGTSFPFIGRVEGATIMETGSYSWTVAAPLTTPNTTHIKSLIAENTASSYITYIDALEGIKVHNINDATNYAKINSSGLHVYQNGNNVARFGATAKIGTDTKTSIVIDDNGMSFRYNQEEKGRINLQQQSGAFLEIGFTHQLSSTETSYDNYLTLIGDQLNLAVKSSDGDASELHMYKDVVLRSYNHQVLFTYPTENYRYARSEIYVDYKAIENDAARICLASTKYLEIKSNNIYFSLSPWNTYTANRNNTKVYIYMQSIPLDTTGNYVMLNSAGYLTRGESSSRQYKHDIKPIVSKELNPQNLYDIEVVQFIYNDNHISSKDQRFHKKIPGFIAEDVYKHYPIAVNLKNGRPEDWNHRYILPPMLKLIQEQHDEIEALKARIDILEGEKL